MDDQDVDDCDGMSAYRRREADLDELLEIAARHLRAAELEQQAETPATPPTALPAHPRFARHVGRLSDREQDEWVDRMKNRYGGEW